MTQKNPEYDFEWCPGCGDFGVRRALERAIERRIIETEEPVESNVIVAGIGCSGNMVHLLDGPQPYGIHGLHGRTLPIAMGVKMGRPELNVVVVAGDGDFLSIGMEHIAPQAQRNLNVCAVIMDNAVYGLTKGQSSPTSELGMVTSSTPYGKTEDALNALRMYLTFGVSFVASAMSSKINDLADMIVQGMEYPGFSIVHVQSPCTVSNDTYEELKGSKRKGIEPKAWPIDEGHDPADLSAAHEIVDKGGVPLPSSPDELVTEGLDGLRDRLKEYADLGAGFTKWRAVITITDDIPTSYGMAANAHALARFAALSQEAGLVPIVEPEVLRDGDHSIERCLEVTEETLREVFDQLAQQKVLLEGMLLKPSMVISGGAAEQRAKPEDVAKQTIECFKRVLPSAVPGVVFLSGGEPDNSVTANLNAINQKAAKLGAPWQLSFSFGRSLQGAPLAAWAGKSENTEAATLAFFTRARLTSAARQGNYEPED